MNSFMTQVKEQLLNSEANLSVTENGAVGFKSTGKKLLDLNFAVSSLRDRPEEEIEARFLEVLAEDRNAAIVWLFFARDVRGGMGERRLFRIGMHTLAWEHPDLCSKLLRLVAEYGRWDDLFSLWDTNLRFEVATLLMQQLSKDKANACSGAPVSLLAKWMPSENASSKRSHDMAKEFREIVHLSSKDYRKMLSSLRKHIRIVESQMSANQWGEINYQAVPSKANLLYNSAFLRHDTIRRIQFLSKVEQGEAKINASVAYPYEIVAGMRDKDKHTMEALWKALPNTVEGGNTLVVADGSGSMSDLVSKATRVTALDVANSLAIYFAERMPEPYKDKYITFSEHPQFVDFCGATTLEGKLKIARLHNEVADTNIERVFDLILQTAVANQLKQEELPANILIISDMEFNDCAMYRGADKWGNGSGYMHTADAALFNVLAARYAKYGYHLPRLVFWNVCSRTETIPIRENEAGVALVSGFSPNVAKMVMSAKLDPYDAMMDTLHSPRYDAVWEILK